MFKILEPLSALQVKTRREHYLEYIEVHTRLNRISVGCHNEMIILEADQQTQEAEAVLRATAPPGERITFPKHFHSKGEETVCLEGFYGEYLEPGESADDLFEGAVTLKQFQSAHPGVVEVLGAQADGRVPVKLGPGARWSMGDASEHKPFGFASDGGLLLGQIHWGGPNEITEGRRDVRTIAMLAYKGCGEQDTLAPWEMFRSAAWVLGQHGRALEVTLLGLEAGPVEMQMGSKVVTEETLRPDHKLYDLLYVPGGLGSGDASRDPRILEFVRRHHEAGRLVATNCSGASILHRAGILGRTPVTAAATISRKLAREGVNVAAPRRMWLGVPEANLWTSAGGSAVHASTMALIWHLYGETLGTQISMMWDTLASLGERIFELEGPEYLTYPQNESRLQDDFEDKLLPSV